MATILVLLFFATAALSAYLLIEAVLGPDPDLDAPWRPGDRPRWRA
jgi:hypothetical protein